MRPSGRAPDEMRAIFIETAFTKHAEGSVLIGFGDTQVLCTASVEDRLPQTARARVVRIGYHKTRDRNRHRNGKF